MDDILNSMGLLAYAEVLNETLYSFLTPEEGDEKRRSIGFDQRSHWGSAR
jgi:hypothetical protein